MRRWYRVRNGDMYVDMWQGYCNRCGKYIHESYPHEELGGSKILCCECAFIKGYWSEEDYLHNACYWNPFIKRAAVKDGKVYTTDKKFPWEKTPKQQRHGSKYIDWRTAVFERDKYTCAICGKVGGELNAHHIKSFKDYPKFRLDVDNGITFCKKCHKKVHREKDSEWIYFAEQGNQEQRYMEQASIVCEGMDVFAD